MKEQFGNKTFFSWIKIPLFENFKRRNIHDVNLLKIGKSNCFGIVT